MNRNEKFLLYKVSPEQRKQLLLVMLFLESLEAAAMVNGQNMLHIGIHDLHNHFPVFAAAVASLEENLEAYKQDAKGVCPAVHFYHYLEDADSKDEIFAYIVHLRPWKTGDEDRLEADELIKAIPALHLDVDYESLVRMGTEVLRKLGKLTPQTA